MENIIFNMEGNVKMTIGTLNVRGLNNTKKRLKLFNWVNDKNIDIMLLQETFWTKDSVNICKNEWNGHCYIAPTDSTHSRGVAIMISKKFNCNILSSHISVDGRKVLVNIEHNSKKLSLISLYAPNPANERKTFLDETHTWIKMFALSSDIIIGGDLNTTDSVNDRASMIVDQCTTHFQNFKQNLNILDIWRFHNPNKKSYTYINPTNSSRNSRIDYILANSYINSCTKLTSIIPAPTPDHKCVLIQVDYSNRKRGQGYWKLNSFVLNETCYQKMIEKLITKTVNDYKNHLSARVLLDFLKLRIKESSIKYCINRAKKHSQIIRNVENKLHNIDNLIASNSNSENTEELQKDRNTYQNQLDEYYLEKSEGARIRSKCKWIEQGERNTKFFHQLEKQRQSKNVIDDLTTHDGSHAITDEEILNECKDFYQNLYTSKNIDEEAISNYINETKVPNKLSDEEQEICEGVISIEECTNALKLMGNDKSPGLDGLPIEFYKQFWNFLGDIVIDSFNESLKNTSLSESQKCSILSLIYKKGDEMLLKNYRPISLTNTDYRLLTFCLSLRLQKVIGSIIGQEQTGYIRKRFIGTNARLIEDVIEYCDRFHQNGLILFLDFEKAFDTVEWPFMMKTLKAFNFGQSFINWMKTLYTNPSCKIKNNGHLSNVIDISRGIRQGCAISAMAFILVVEILSLRIKDTNAINGIQVKLPNHIEHEQLLSQYADDMSLFLNGEDSIKPLFNCINKFSSLAGPKLNLEKTEGLWLGPLKQLQQDCSLFNIKWPNKPIRSLGIYVGHNKTECYELNWEKKLKIIENSANIWSLRKLSFIGKVHIIKSELISKMIYTASILPIPDGIISKLNKIIHKFLWGGSEKIQRTILTNDLDQGGLKMINIELQFLALKAAWIPRYLANKTTDALWTVFPTLYFSKIAYNDLILKMNAHDPKQICCLNILPKFYQEIVIAFNKSKTSTKPTNRNEILDSLLWGNSHFSYQIQNKSHLLNILEWQKAGLFAIKDFKFVNGKLDQTYILRKVGKRPNIFHEIKIVLLSLKPYLQIINNHDPVGTYPFTNIPYLENRNSLVDIKHLKSKYFYNALKDKIQEFRPKAEIHWVTVFSNQEIDFQKCYMTRVKNIKDFKLAEFNFKFYHKILSCEYNLFKWKIQDNYQCLFCNTTSDSIHMLFDCKCVSSIWNSLYQSNYFKQNQQNLNFVFETFFSNNLSRPKIFALSCLTYSIYAEWLNRKNNNIIRSERGIANFIYNSLYKRKTLYHYLQWKDEVKEIQALLECIT